MHAIKLDLDDYKVVTGDDLYTILAPEGPQTFVDLRIRSNKPSTVWVTGSETRHPLSVGEQHSFRSRVVGLLSIEITAPKSCVISYSVKLAQCNEKEVLDLTPVEIIGPDPVEEAENRRVRDEVRSTLLRMGIDPDTIVEEELSDDEAFDADEEDIDFGNPYADPDELLIESTPVSEPVHDPERDRSGSEPKHDAESAPKEEKTDAE